MSNTGNPVWAESDRTAILAERTAVPNGNTETRIKCRRTSWRFGTNMHGSWPASPHMSNFVATVPPHRVRGEACNALRRSRTLNAFQNRRERREVEAFSEERAERT